MSTAPDNPSDHFIEPVADVSDVDTYEDYVDGDDDDEEEDENEGSDDDDGVEVEDKDEDEESDDDGGVEVEEEEDRMVTLLKVSVDLNKGAEVAGEEKCRGDVGDIDGLMCPISMGTWTSGGDHQVCVLNAKGDVRVLYASRVVVADEESKEKIQFLEANCLLEEANANLEASYMRMLMAEKLLRVEERQQQQQLRYHEEVWQLREQSQQLIECGQRTQQLIEEMQGNMSRQIGFPGP